MTMTSLTPDLAELDRQFAAAKAEASELVNGLKESQFNWRPDAHSWSMAECLLHLNIVGDRCVHVLEKTLQHRATAQTKIQGSPQVHAIVRPAHHRGAADVPASTGATGAAAGTSQRTGSGARQGAGARGGTAQVQPAAYLRLDRCASTAAFVAGPAGAQSHGLPGSAIGCSLHDAR